jgi:hypothetical protein
VGGATPRGPTGLGPLTDAPLDGSVPRSTSFADGRPGFGGRVVTNPLPAPAVLDRGSPERPFPSSAPPAGRGVGEGLLPMGAGAMGRPGPGEHRRPAYLVDDGSAFADDRRIPSSVINEGWPRD